MKRLIIATGNKNKAKEIRDLLNLNHLKLLFLNELENSPFPEAIEDGNSFLENAQIKARHYFEIFKEPVIADDSGLVVPVLNNEPGIYSSRYAGPKATDRDNNELLLEKLATSFAGNRKAYFKTVIIYKDHKQEAVFEGNCHGRIIKTAKGANGFGYDPLFFLDEIQKTFAELEPFEKNKYSHRGKATAALKKFLINKV